MNDNFNQEALTLVLAGFYLFGVSFWCVIHVLQKKIQAYLVPALSQSFL